MKQRKPYIAMNALILSHILFVFQDDKDTRIFDALWVGCAMKYCIARPEHTILTTYISSTDPIKQAISQPRKSTCLSRRTMLDYRF